MDSFITWDILSTYVSFVGTVFMVVEFTKTLPIIKKISTKYWSFLVAFILLTIVKFHSGDFASFDIVIYFLSSIAISLSSNGLYDFNKKETKE